MQLDYLPETQTFVWRGPYEKRNVPQRAGFLWNSNHGAWITTNPVVAARTGLNGQQVSLATRKLNMSTSVLIEADVSPSCSATKAVNADDCLLPYQQVPYEYAKHDRFLLLADDTGLGKTMEALSFAMNDPIENHLIICPANKREDWSRELRKWVGDSAYIRYSRIPICAFELKPTFILSWKMLEDLYTLDLIKTFMFDHLILDEVQAIKNGDSLRTRLTLELSRRCGRVTALSATFPPNYPTELHPLLSAFAPATIDHMNYDTFMHTYCQTTQYDGVYRPVGFKNTLDLSERLRSTCMVRRRFHWVHKQLPRPKLKIIEFTPDKQWRKFIKEEKRFEAEYFRNGNAIKVPASEYAALRNEMAEAKIDLVAEYARRILEFEPKLLILGWHKVLIMGLVVALQEYNPVFVTGAVTAKNKFKRKEQFQTDPKFRVFLGNIQSAGIGIDLTAARHVIFAEASWVPGENHQGIGRIYRFGQVKQTIADFVVVEGTLDAKVLETAMKKQEGLTELLDTRKEIDSWAE